MSKLPLGEAVALGAVQGPTELLPVSSSGHLVLVPALMRWQYRELDPELRKAFEVALHAGGALALLIGLRREVREYVRSFGPENLATLALSFAPAAAAAYLFERPIERRLGDPVPVAVALLVGSAAMALADGAPEERERDQAGPLDALAIGFAQAFALAPGISRNGATLTAARLLRFRRADANVISRQIALPVILGAAALKGARLARRGVPPEIARGMVAGAATAFVSTLLSLRLITMLERSRSLRPYAAYRAAVGAGALVALAQEGRMSDSYARAGVDTGEARGGVHALVSALSRIKTGRASRSIVPSGHYASVLALDELIAVAICTDGVGTKLIVAEAMNRFDTVGIDCVAMNVNDLVCVGAEPIALVDYVAVEAADEAMLGALGEGLREGASQAAVEIPGGEFAQVPEMLRGHPSPRGVDLVGTAIGVVQRDRILTGERIAPGDVVIGAPSSGLHSNGYSLARRALREQGGFTLEDSPPELGRPLADELLEPTAIYVRAAMDLLRSEVPVHGLAHITGDGLLNLLRLNPEVGYHVDAPLEPQPIFGLIQRCGEVPDAEMWEVFNMGTGLCCIVDGGDAPAATEILGRRHPGTRVIGEVTDSAGTVRLPSVGLVGDRSSFRNG